MMRCRYEFNLSAQFYDILFIQHDSEASVVAKLPEISQVRWLSDTFYCSSVYLFAIRKLISGRPRPGWLDPGLAAKLNITFS